jgi:hemolysin-activating ACP:hemolysin acyltransferase
VRKGYVGDYFDDEVAVIERPEFTIYEDHPLQQPIGFVNWAKLRGDVVVADDIVGRPLTRRQRKKIKKAIEAFGRG